jgi:opacity protein-like surface antigen
MRTLFVWMGAVVVTAGFAAAAMPDAIDLSSLNDVVAPQAPPDSVWNELALEPVSSTQVGQQRFYVTGMLGESFATLAEPLYQEVSRGSAINRSVFTAGGAAGIAFERDNGRLRIEVEGRGRDDVTAGLNQSLPEEFAANFNWAAADGWSALFNVWRDFSVSEKVDLYLGGGVGGGGYRYSMAGSVACPGEETVLSYTGNAQVASFAWQAGGGVIWNLSDRVAFDVGYRFFSIDQSPTTLTGFIDGVPLGSIVLPQQFTASELLFGLRIYEPFRRWR